MRRSLLVLVALVSIACGTIETPENRAIRTLQAALPASTREAQGLPFGGWSARMSSSWMTVTLPLNVDADVERGLRSSRAALVRGAAQVFNDNSEIEHLTIFGTLPYGPNQTDVSALVGDIQRSDVASWDGSDQLGLWKMTIPSP